MPRWTRNFTLILLSCLSCNCSFLTLANPAKTSTAADVIRFSTTRPEFKDIIVKVGEQEDYDVYLAPSGDISLDQSVRGNLYLELKKGLGFGDGMMINMTGHINVSFITFDSNDNGQTWNCKIYARGNFGNDSSDTALKLWKEFKSKLITSAGFELMTNTPPPSQPKIATAEPELKPKPTPPTNRKSAYPEIINVP